MRSFSSQHLAPVSDVSITTTRCASHLQDCRDDDDDDDAGGDDGGGKQQQ